MTNLIISRRCNQSCPYCFAENSSSEAPDQLSIMAFEQRLDYLDRSGISQARFLGGEPTLHPQFPELVRRALAHNKKIIIFTNGLIPPDALQAIETVPPEVCSIVLNMSATGTTGAQPAAEKQRKALLERLGKRIQPGVNIYRQDDELKGLISLIIESNCRKAVRIGLAQPIINGKNTYLPTRHYAQVGEMLARFAESAAQEGIRIEFDCGFVRCMFSEEAIHRLTQLGVDLCWNCGPVIDIDTDGKAFHCFPLSNSYFSQLSPSVSAAELRLELQNKTDLYHQTGIFKNCSTCRYKQEHICSGGCLAHVMRRFSSKPISLKMSYYSFPI
jgi:radical SAM protein with 4Fe4S-binding SPASM domain